MKIIALLPLTLCACTTTGGLIPAKVRGNEVSVSVTNIWNQAQALPLADAHCHKYSRAARFVRMEGYVASFDCVKVD